MDLINIKSDSCKTEVKKSCDSFNIYNFFNNEETMCVITKMIIRKHE